MNIHSMKIITMAIIILLLTAGCDNNSPTVTPESATISGIITFTGDWPETGSISVSAMDIWDYTDPGFTGVPIKSITVLESEVSSNTYVYTLESLPFDDYNAIVVTWLDPEDTSYQTMYHTLGAYGGTSPFYAAMGGTNPTTVIVSEANYSVSGIDFIADFSLAVSSNGGI